MLPTTIPWKLLQGIALVQLYLEERWVEPPRLDRLPFSLVYHQTMSTLASCGEMSPRMLADRILSLHYFHRISQEDFKVLLRHLLETDHIQYTDQGGLIVGLTGERVVNSFKFYGVFQESEEYTVRNESQELGTIVSPPPLGEKLAIAGAVWRVLDIDHKRHLVYCEQVKGSVPAYFGECPGDLHTRILERMRAVLREERSYPYLMKNAVARLNQARGTARASGAAERSLINLGGNMWCLLPWLGTYSFLALERFLKIKCAERLGLRNLDSARPFFLQFTMQADERSFYTVLSEEIRKPIDPLELVYPKELPLFDKYDEYLPEELVKKGFAYGVLDLDGLRKRILSWEEEGSMSKKFLVLWLAVMFVCSAASADADDAALHETETLTLVICSDLHFSLSQNASIYPLLSRIEDLTNAIADEVIALQPDAFILCGDNTNSGRDSDAAALAAILQRVRDSGIPVIAVTGNHDFDLGDCESYKDAYFGLCDVEQRDRASLSFVTHVGQLCLLAMDDNSASKGARGYFTAETMDWLKTQLEKAKDLGKPVVYVSHHNVLPGGEAAEGSGHMIQNTELRDLLIDYGVQLCLSGHRHAQEILEHEGMYEIISAMPVSWPHLIGVITLENGHLSYRAKPLDTTRFGTYDLQAAIEQEQAVSGNYDVFVQGLEGWLQYSEEEQEEIERLFCLFMEAYSRGNLAGVKEEICSSACYDAMLQLLAPTNYGPWIRYMLETTRIPGNSLELDSFCD